MTAIAIRPEQPDDAPSISALITAAFAGKPYSNGNEAVLVESLRADGDLAISLVAENMDKAIIGHLAFSPVTISDGTNDWFAGGPLSVIPLRQSNGFGSALITRGLAELRQLGAAGCVLLGDPELYSRFGFEHDPQLTYAGGAPEKFQRLVLEGEAPRGEVIYAPAFN